MSLHCIVAVMDTAPQREFSDRLVLFAMANQGSTSGGRIWPGKTVLAGDSGVSERTVTDSIRRLEKDGWIWVHRRGSGRKSHYVLLLDTITSPLVPSDWDCSACLARAHEHRAAVAAKRLDEAEQLLEEAGRRSPRFDDMPAEMPADGPTTAPVDNETDRGDARPASAHDESGEPGRPASSTGATGVSKQGDRSPSTRSTRSTQPHVDADAPTHRQIMDALVEAFNPPLPLTRSEGGRYAAAARDLRPVLLSVDDLPEIARRTAAWANDADQSWQKLTRTPTGLAANWSRWAPKTRTTDTGPTEADAIRAAQLGARLPWHEVVGGLEQADHTPAQIIAAHVAWMDLQQGAA